MQKSHNIFQRHVKHFLQHAHFAEPGRRAQAGGAWQSVGAAYLDRSWPRSHPHVSGGAPGELACPPVTGVREAAGRPTARCGGDWRRFGAQLVPLPVARSRRMELMTPSPKSFALGLLAMGGQRRTRPPAPSGALTPAPHRVHGSPPSATRRAATPAACSSPWTARLPVPHRRSRCTHPRSVREGARIRPRRIDSASSALARPWPQGSGGVLRPLSGHGER
jgi:hypothetical protein